MVILAIETSCDETSVAIVKATTVVGSYKFEILSNVVLSQIKTHARWGGVVPSLAKREHSKNLIPILKKSLSKAKLLLHPHPKGYTFGNNEIQKILSREPELLKQFLEFMPAIKPPKIDIIAVTVGPGLEPALWVGINFAKALSLVWDKPIVAVNHMEGHIAAVLLGQNSGISNFPARLDFARRCRARQFPISKQILKSKTQTSKQIHFPALALLVSGGHTELALIKKWGDYKIIGETRDDAAGECFDKVARMLGLPYPGGPAIAAEAAKFSISPPASQARALRAGNFQFSNNFDIKLPRPMINSNDYDFSFSGLKTAVLYFLKDLEKMVPITGGRLKLVPFICGEFQQAVIDVLIAKTIKAAGEFKVKTIILGGGVAANKELRKQMAAAIKKNLPNVDLRLPAYKLTTDNAAMIAAAGYLRALKSEFTKHSKLKAKGNLKL